MGQASKEREQDRRAQARLRVIHHYEQVTKNVSRTCRFFGVSRTIFCRWQTRYRESGFAGCATVSEDPVIIRTPRRLTSWP